MENTAGGRIKDNLKRVADNIREAQIAAGRKEGEVSLLAVSKFHSAAAVLEAIAAGQRAFGENRVQEAEAKFSEVKEHLAPLPIECGHSPAVAPAQPAASYPESLMPCSLHIIGTLQSNKILKAVKIADMIESVDSVEHLEQIEKQCAKIDKTMKVLFELHTGEESKSGFPSIDEMRRALASCAEGRMMHVLPCGFMTMAPLTADEKVQRASFAALRAAKETLSEEFPAFHLDVLSMGMSADYKAAIMEGSTEVRIGTAIFGQRA